jgi:Holliday junction DNA helicase RuvA
MIAFLDGKIILKKEKFVIIEVAGIGYKVFLSKSSLFKITKINETIKLYIYHHIKEEASDLYGFLTYGELEFFEILLNIRGVGPRLALDISQLGSLDKIKEKILNQDEKIFDGIAGVGSKKASTIILELTGKIQLLDKKQSADEAENALVQLGFSKHDAKDALSYVPQDIKKTEERIKVALKRIGK